jgi:hypothetical protein
MGRSADLLKSQGTTPDGARLEVLCGEIVDILQAGSEHLPGLAALRDELAGVLQAGARELAARLRQELPCWTAALENLRQLSRCRYLTLPENLATLRDELERAGRQAQQVAEALESLGRGRPPPVPPATAERPRLLCFSPQEEKAQEPRSEKLLEVGRSWSPTSAGGALAGRPPPVTAGTAPDHPEARARPRAIREVQKERAGCQEPPAASTPPPRKANPPSEGPALRVVCPTCGAGGAIRWDRLGRLHICRGCSRTFRVDPGGGLVEIIRTKDNKWVDRAAHTSRSTRSRLLRFVGRRLLPALGLAAAVLLVIWLSSRPATSSEVALPRELEPRVELFTRAWLNKDWAKMRLVVTPGEDRALYKWSVRHPPAARSEDPAGQDVPIEVTVLATQAQKARVKVRIRGPDGPSGKGASEWVQFWEERGGTWFFLVPAR